MGVRTVLDTPLLREGIAIGAIHIRRREVRPFSDKQIKLLETFPTRLSLRSRTCGVFKTSGAQPRPHGGARATDRDG